MPQQPDRWDGEARVAIITADLAPLFRDGIPKPCLLPGDLLYEEGVHMLAGPPDSGKTTVALWVMLHVLQSGRNVMMLDEESGQAMVAEKLIALGATEDDVQRLTYIPFPCRRWGMADILALRELVDETQPAMILFDSVAAFMATAGLDENNAGDVTGFWSRMLIPLARYAHAAVVAIDHDGKGSEASRFSRGSSAKLAASDVMVKVEMIHPFSRSMDGLLKLSVTKDRRGYLHRNWQVTIRTGRGIEVAIAKASTADANMGDLSPAEQKLLEALTDEPRSQREVVDAIAAVHVTGLRRMTATEGLKRLCNLGLADRIDQGEGRAALWMKTADQGNLLTCTPPAQ